METTDLTTQQLKKLLYHEIRVLKGFLLLYTNKVDNKEVVVIRVNKGKKAEMKKHLKALEIVDIRIVLEENSHVDLECYDK